ncbi:MAG: type II secretion system F family protein [Magnetococcales bacterium]|nr:type II secretion system F family protein [Magnetococcales bacterium]
MAFFHYKVITEKGKMKTGLMELPFDSAMSAITYLEQQGSAVIFVKPLPEKLGKVVARIDQFFEYRWSVSDIAELLNNIAIMLKAGIPILPAVKDTIASSDNQTIAKVGGDMVYRIETGSNFSEAASKWERFFPENIVYLFRIGEETGNLDLTVKDASKHMVKVDRMRSGVKRALRYPIITLVAIFGAAAFWLVWVVPMMMDMFESFEMELPQLTITVIALSDFLQEYAISVLVTIVTIVFLIKYTMKKNLRFRWYMHWIFLHLPILRPIINNSNLAFITEYFSLMLRSGVDVMTSIDIMYSSLTNQVYKQKMGIVRESLIQGNGLRDSFAAGEIFPPFVVRMIGVGEQSGSLSEQLDYAAEEYDRKLTELIENISDLIQPIALFIGGGVFIVLLLSMFMPLYQLIGA